MALQRGSYINLTEPRSKKKRRVDNSDWRPWSDLPEALLDLITQSLGAIDYLMFGCVCKGWRLYVAAYKQEFMASQPPLFIFLSRNAKRACYFYSIFDHRFYKAKLPNLVGKSCTGVTCGYLVMKDKKKTEDSQIWLLNPFTRHELHFPNPPNVCSRFILASLATTLPAFVLIAFDGCDPYLQFCRSTDISWTVYDSREKFIGFREPIPSIVDGVVFKGKIYVLTVFAEIGVLNLNSHPYVTLLEVKSIELEIYTWRLRLLGSNEQLLMIYETSSNEYEVYVLNFLKMEWEKMQNFGNQALFLGHIKGSGCCNVSTWKGRRQPSNCIYVVGYQTCVYTLHFLDGRYPELIIHSHRMPNVFLPFWYFPHVSCSVDSVSDD